MTDKSRVTRAITKDGSYRAFFINSTSIVQAACRYHNTSKTMTAVLGRALTAASLMGIMLKNKTDSLTLRIQGDGPAGAIVCVSDYMGNVRGYAENMDVEVQPHPNGKLNVGGAVGNGNLFVIRDLGMNEPYIGSCELVTGEIGEDITQYFVSSEQTPTICSLGVKVDKDNMCISSGGFLIQAMPGAEQDLASVIEQNVQMMKPVSLLVQEGKSDTDILSAIFGSIEYEVFDSFDAEYRCTCSYDKYLNAIASLSANDVEEVTRDMKPIETVCKFCGKKYMIDPEEVLRLIEEKKKK